MRRAAQLFEGAGAIVTPMRPFLTRQMLDGMAHAWRMRSHLDLAALPADDAPVYDESAAA